MTAAISSLVVAAIGALVTHQFAYLLAYPVSSTRQSALTDHGHMSLLWALLTPAAILGAATLVLHQARGLGFGSRLSGRTLAILTVALFATQEWIETFAAYGDPIDATTGVLTSPAILIGLALAPLVGMALAHFLAVAGAVIAAFVALAAEVAVPKATAFGASDFSWTSVQLIRVAPTRGPPVRIR